MPGQPTDVTRMPRRKRALPAERDVPTNLGTSASHNHAPGDVIGNHYEVVRQIGAGGMGVVYEVINKITGVPVAIKRLSCELSNSKEHRDAFIREATDSMKFTGKSEYFVTTQTVDIDAIGPFIVVEYVEHPTLRTIIERHPDGMSTDLAINILHGLAFSLTELHRLGFVHRDLKPENVFIGPPADKPLVMLADFGLSKSLTDRTRTSIRRAGTDRYISPEQRNGLETDVTTDIYAFGIMAMEMLNGDVLSPGDSLFELRPEIPIELCEYITKCTKGRREQRPADSNELFDFFDALRSGSISPVYPPAIVHFVAKQPDVVIDVDGSNSPASLPLEIPFDTADERRIKVEAKWKHVSLLISFLNLQPGDEHTIELPAGYSFDAKLPDGCTLHFKNGSEVPLPLSGVVPQQGYFYFDVFHGTEVVLSQKVIIHVGGNFWQPSIVLPAKPDLRRTTLRFTNLQPDAIVTVDGTIVDHKAGWSAMVAAERIRRVKVEVDWRGFVVLSSTLPLNSGENRVVDVPLVYQLNADLPKEVTVKNQYGDVQSFPIRGLVPSGRLLLLSVFYRGMPFGKFEVPINSVDVAWAPVLPIPQPSLLVASKLELVDVQLGANVWIDGALIKAPYIGMFDIAIGSSKVVSVKCKWHNMTLYSSRVRITAGKTRKVSIPKGFELHATNIPPNSRIETMDGLSVTFPYLGIVPESRKVSFTLHQIGKSPIVREVPVHIGACLWNVARVTD
jgi:serine/threonine protein kinase